MMRGLLAETKTVVDSVHGSLSAWPPHWLRTVLHPLQHRSLDTLILLTVLPWVALGLYAAYYYCRYRYRLRCAGQGGADEVTIATFRTFFAALAQGSSSGYDKALMQLFHPVLLRERRVERGLVRAMARCVHAQLGSLQSIPPHTICVKHDGMQVNCVALVDFEHVRGVRCQLSWVRRFPAKVRHLISPTWRGNGFGESGTDRDNKAISSSRTNSSAHSSDVDHKCRAHDTSSNPSSCSSPGSRGRKSAANPGDDTCTCESSRNSNSSQEGTSCNLTQSKASAPSSVASICHCKQKSSIDAHAHVGRAVNSASSSAELNWRPVVKANGTVDASTFSVTGFHVSPSGNGSSSSISRDAKRKGRASGVELDILQYLDAQDFEPIAELFVERLLLDRPPASAVSMMATELQQRHSGEEKLAALQQSVQSVLRACGGLGKRRHDHNETESADECTGELDATITETKLVRDSGSPPRKSTSKDEKTDTATRIYGLDVTFHVTCRIRHMQVYVRLAFEDLRCCVIRYELRMLPDERRHVFVDGKGKNPEVVA